MSTSPTTLEAPLINIDGTNHRDEKLALGESHGEEAAGVLSAPARGEGEAGDASLKGHRRMSEDEVDGLVGEPESAGKADSTAAEEQHIERDELEGDEARKDDRAGSEVEGEDSSPSPAVASAIHRAPTPSSRTSTPPLASGSAPKKFSSVSVNKKFLSKAATPAGLPSGGAKLTLNVPITSSSSRLLSTKLTTVPTSKSTSPLPPPAGSAGTSSPWAKPSLLPPSDSSNAGPRRLQNAAAGVAMGSGQGIGAQKMAWRPVSDDKGRVAMSRDFPTTKEIAEGKMAAQLAAQAQAAHNQQILQQLNTFTQLDPNAHRWDDEDDEDDIIDFGDGVVYTHEHHLEPEPEPDIPVNKSERFAEDFDRSWPRKQPTYVEPVRATDAADRVLFNAASNRLEPTQPRHPPPPPQPRIMARPTDTKAAPPSAARSSDRPLPPHLQVPAANGRMLPPHMTQAPPPPQTRSLGNIARQDGLPSRQAWGAIKEPDTLIASSDPPPPRQPVNQPAQPPIISPSKSNTTLPDGLPVDTQSAEMHNAAEKARLRRLAEEEEREAAAERARRKAKELEERLGLKTAQPAAPPPGLPNAPPMPSFTIAVRPKPTPPIETTPAGMASLPLRPPEGRVETSWRTKLEDAAPPATTARATAESYFEGKTAVVDEVQELEAAVNAMVLEDKPAKKESNFDSMLARIQAAMAEARAPPVPAAVEHPTPPKSPEILTPEPRVLIPQPVTQPAPAKVPAALPIPPRVDFFDVTQPLPPRSPPPAWQTYPVRIPKLSITLPPIPPLRLRALERPLPPPPKGWVWSFNPPIEFDLAQSRADMLLPQPILRRFQKDTGPVVSISPRELEPFARKAPKKKSYDKPLEVEVPNTPAETLLPSATAGPSNSVTLRGQMTTPSTTSDARWDGPLVERRKSRSPVKKSPAAKAEKSGLFAQDGVAGLPDRGRLETRPGVRFMVSSELEGDSLLEEVNKMSLDTVGEGDDQAEEAKTPGTETPKTPPSLSGASSRGHPTSPNGSSTPWSKSSARSSSQHDTLRSVWEAPIPPPEPSRAPQHTQAPAQPTDVATPMYPSLNAPSSADPPTAQALPAPKMGYSTSQAFASPVHNAFAPNNNAYRSTPPANYGYGPHRITSPEGSQNSVGLAYASLGQGSANGSLANGFPQAVWSPSAFGSGYGYSPASGPTKSSPEHAMSNPAAVAASKSAQDAYGAQAKDGVPYQHSQYHNHLGQQSPVYAQQVQHSPGYQQAYRPQGQGYHAANTVVYGAPGQQAQVRSRFGQVNGEHGAYGYSASRVPEAGYYGGVGQAGYGYGSAGGHGAIGQQHGRGVAGPGAGARKMW